MEYEGFRRHMNHQWEIFDREATEAKNSREALAWISDWYRRIPTECEDFASKVVSEWLLADNGRKRFDAIAVVSEHHLVNAVPALKALRDRLGKTAGAPARHDREQVEKVLRELG